MNADLEREIALGMVAATRRNAPPLFAHLVARAFSQRIVEHRLAPDFADLSAWTDRTCEHYGNQADLAPMLAAACSVARTSFVRHRLLETDVDAALVALERSIVGSLERHAAANALDDVDPDAEVDASIAAFLIRLDGSDPVTAEHSRAVSMWALRLARRLGMGEGAARFVARGGMLHDVGKTKTPVEILQAPRALTDTEFAIMRDHAAIGGDLVREVELLRPYVPMVRSHHERLDGRGYPDKMRAEDITLEIRIVTVADCFNAMIGRRPYRLPMSPAKALEQLVEHRGTQFDPSVVEAMIDVIEHPDRDGLHA